MKLGSCQLPPGPAHPESAKPSAPLTPRPATYHHRLMLFSDPPRKWQSCLAKWQSRLAK